jgi:hypothetical protein
VIADQQRLVLMKRDQRDLARRPCEAPTTATPRYQGFRRKGLTEV